MNSSIFIYTFLHEVFSTLINIYAFKNKPKTKPSSNQTPSSPCVEDEVMPLHGHQPSHQDKPGGAVIEGILAVTEDVGALFGAGIGAGVIHKSLIVYQVGHLALSLVRQLCNLRVSGGEGRRGSAVSQVLVNTTVEDGRAERVDSLGTVARTRER